MFVNILSPAIAITFVDKLVYGTISNVYTIINTCKRTLLYTYIYENKNINFVRKY